MSNVPDLTVDPARVLQRLLSGDPMGAMYAQVAIRDVLLTDAHARIAELEQPGDTSEPA